MRSSDDLEESGVGGVDDALSGHGQPPDAVQPAKAESNYLDQSSSIMNLHTRSSRSPAGGCRAGG